MTENHHMSLTQIGSVFDPPKTSMVVPPMHHHSASVPNLRAFGTNITNNVKRKNSSEFYQTENPKKKIRVLMSTKHRGKQF